MTPLLLAIVAFVFTLLGGLTAIKYKKQINHILGFTAGVIIGLIAFDLLPEIFKLVQKTGIDATVPMIALVCGFLLFHIAEKALLIHHSHESAYGAHRHPQVGILSALALSGHSFLDGVGIGIGFQVNPAVGIAVAVAVISHDFADGLNTVSLMLHNKNTNRRALFMLILDALAPILGVISTLFFTFSEGTELMYLGFFAGFLLYIGASDILPQAHEKKSSRLTIVMTVIGVLFIFMVTRFV